LLLHSQIIIPIYAATLRTTRKYSIHSPNIPNSTTPYLLLLLLLMLLLMLLLLCNASCSRSRSIWRFSRTTSATTHAS
jgi:glucan phosphoethanolaminetransferase (alkaline phosphatase superfamily)